MLRQGFAETGLTKSMVCHLYKHGEKYFVQSVYTQIRPDGPYGRAHPLDAPTAKSRRGGDIGLMLLPRGRRQKAFGPCPGFGDIKLSAPAPGLATSIRALPRVWRHQGPRSQSSGRRPWGPTSKLGPTRGGGPTSSFGPVPRGLRFKRPTAAPGVAGLKDPGPAPVAPRLNSYSRPSNPGATSAMKKTTTAQHTARQARSVYKPTAQNIFRRV
jgi:hypothetical protein